MKSVQARALAEARRPFATPRLGFYIAEAGRAVTGSSLAPRGSRNSISRAIAEIVDLAEQIIDERNKVEPPRGAIHCRPGCSHCCYMRVHVTPPEVILLADFVKANFAVDQFEGLVRRLTENASTLRGVTDEEHGRAGIPCPLLVDDFCSAYVARPLECRGYASTDVTACKRALNDYDSWNVPIYRPQYSIFKYMQMGLVEALMDSDYEFELLELTAALRIALEVPDVADRWLAGEFVFADAALSHSDPEVDAANPWTNTFDVPNSCIDDARAST